MGDIGVCLKIWYSKFQTNLISFIIIFPQFATSFGAAKSIEQLVLPFLAFLARPGQAKNHRILPAKKGPYMGMCGRIHGFYVAFI